jgi:hypothetical protein
MPDVVVEQPKMMDILDKNPPALSTTTDIPVVETKPDASPPKEPAPAEPEVKTAPVAEVEESTSSDKPDDPPAEPEPKKAKGVQKRIDELTRQREDERRRAEAAEARLDRALSALERPKLEVKDDDQEPQKPQRDPNDPEGYDGALEKYVTDRASWIARREVKASIAEEDKKRLDARLAQDMEQARTSYKTRVEKAKEKYPDYSEVAESPDVQVTPHMANAIFYSEDGPDIAHFLGKNPAEAERISKLLPQLQLVELGKISQRISTPPTSAKSVSAAPAPGKPIKASSEVSKSPEEESMEEYASRRKKQLAEERRPGGMRH